jgi:hypothetical protein
MAGCSVCKAELMEGARFCVKCGNAVGSVIRETAVGDAVQEPAAPDQALSTTTTAVVVKHRSSGLLRILLLITVVLTVLIALVFTGVINTGARSAIIGRWQADLGYVMLWGNVTENLEFFPNGSVTSNREIAVFTGRYQWLDDQTLRIDWKEQGIFGHSVSEIWRVKVSGDTMVVVNTLSGTTTEYRRAP